VTVVPGTSSTSLDAQKRRYRHQWAGLIVGLYFDLASVLGGFANIGGTFSNVDFPGASATQVIGVNDAGQMVGDYFDGTGEHGFVSDGGNFAAIGFPGATRTAAAGINPAGNDHGFVYAGGAFSTVDVAGTRGALLTRSRMGERSRVSAMTP
jgi:hypothetical protein